MQYEAGHVPAQNKKNRDIHEIINCREALLHGIEHINDTGISVITNKLLLELHAVLMRGAENAGKQPGHFRNQENWIGPPQSDRSNAHYVPISCGQLARGMEQLEKYMQDVPADRLIHLALLHAEFESLHPFIDGNGRLGRMLVPLYLWQTKQMHCPAFYISEYLESHRRKYYECLLAVSRHDDWTGWCVFFCRRYSNRRIGTVNGLENYWLFMPRKNHVSIS